VFLSNASERSKIEFSDIWDEIRLGARVRLGGCPSKFGEKEKDMIKTLANLD
jgi:hypothetical protein